MTLPVNTDDWLMIRRDDAAFILAALSHFGEWGFSPLDFERVRQARNRLERGLITPEGEPAKTERTMDLQGETR
jgi:hypothetical protein